MNYRVEKGEVVFYEGRDELQAVEPTCGMGHHPVEFGFKEVSEIFEYQDAELIKAAMEKDGGTYQIIQNGRDQRELLEFSGDQGVYSEPKPNFRVFKMPEVGQPISYGFNGDWYPCGEIAQISKTFKKITSSTGETFYRRACGTAWARPGGTWSMTRGHHNCRNPHF